MTRNAALRHVPGADAAKRAFHEAGPTARPLILDIICGQGGAAIGYWRAGFDPQLAERLDNGVLAWRQRPDNPRGSRTRHVPCNGRRP